MSTREATRSASAERVHHRTNLLHQAAVFVGLFLAPFGGLLAAWLIHFWASGLHIHWGPIQWDINASPAIMPVAVCLVTLAAVLISYLGWQFAEHRKPSLRRALAGSVVTLGVFFAMNVGTGPSWFLSGLFIVVAWMVAAIWAVARLDVTRNDKTNEAQEDTFLEKVGLKGWRARRSTPITDERGQPLATEIEFQHAPGDTFDQLGDAVSNFESASSSPASLSHATPTDRADRSTLTIMHRDPLIEQTELPQLLHAGGSIVDPLLVGKYQNGEWVQAYLAGGRGFSPSSFLMMGMNRTGKTQEESILFSDVISRRDVVILYLNKAKGMQDVRPIIPGIEAAVIDDSPNGALYKEAIGQIKRIISYRQALLAQYAIHEWNAEQCWDNPPWRTADDGTRVQMPRIPLLIVFIGEADAILQDAPGDATYIVSKGLSTGVLNGFSLQRADATKMPTGLRFNLATAWCFGCGDSDSADMALSSWVVKAGAHPEKWGQRKPGYFYFEGLGFDESNFVIPARSFSRGPITPEHPDGVPLRDELLRRNLAWAPRMAKLDQGSADATGQPGEESWWAQTAKSTDELRRKLLAGHTVAAPATASSKVADDDERDWDEMQDDIRNTTEVEGVNLYPDGSRFEDATRELPPRLGPDEQLTWEDSKPAPRDRKAAMLGFARALDELIDDEGLRDPADPTGGTVVVTAGLIADRYPFRSRPYFSAALNEKSQGRLSYEECPTDLILSSAPDLGMAAGKYRLQRPTAGHVE